MATNPAEVHFHFPIEVEVRSVPGDDPTRPGMYFPVEVEVRGGAPGLELDHVVEATFARLATGLAGRGAVA
jgi:hypothetical protein